MALNRPRVAALLEARLRALPGVELAYANPVTGRLLIYHDVEMRQKDIDLIIQEAVALAVQQVATFTDTSRARPSVTPARSEHRNRTGPSFLVAGCAAGTLALSSSSFRQSPWVRVGSILLATAIVVKRGWRRSGRNQQTAATPIRSTQHPLLQIVGSHKRQFYAALSLSVLGQALDMVLPLFAGWILLLFFSGESAILIRLGLTSVYSQLLFLVGAAILVCILAAALAFLSGMLWRNLAQSVRHTWCTTMYTHIQQVKLRYLEGEQTTRLTHIITNDVIQLSRFFATSANDIAQAATGFLVLIPLFLLAAPTIAWVAFLPVPIIAWLSFSNQERTGPAYATNSENESILNSQLTNNLEAIATVKSFGAEAYETDRIDRLSNEYRRSNHRIDKDTTAYIQSVRLCAQLSFGGYLLVGGLAVLTGTLPFGTFNALLGLPNLVLWKIPAVGVAVDQYRRTIDAFGRVSELRSLPVESGISGRRLKVTEVHGEIVLDDVTFAYEGRSPVLSNLSLNIAARKTTGIVGTTGAGKTTIIKLLLRFQDVEAGRVLLDGYDIRSVRLQDLRKTIGMVPQDTFLFNGTVYENITYGTFDADFDQVVNAARLAKADDFIQDLPLRYDTIIGERGATLSGGQKQRISLARAIVKNAPILILDEATSAVDNETEMAIHEAITDFARDRTLIVIAHRLSTIRHADWIYVLGRGGVVIEEGTHDELLQRKGMYASLWRLQIGEASA